LLGFRHPDPDKQVRIARGRSAGSLPNRQVDDYERTEPDSVGQVVQLRVADRSMQPETPHDGLDQRQGDWPSGFASGGLIHWPATC
jgi:hypothetical protein